MEAYFIILFSTIHFIVDSFFPLNDCFLIYLNVASPMYHIQNKKYHMRHLTEHCPAELKQASITI